MVKAAFNNIKIATISTVVPSKSLSLTDDPLLYGGNEKKIRRVIDSSGFLKTLSASEVLIYLSYQIINNAPNLVPAIL